MPKPSSETARGAIIAADIHTDINGERVMSDIADRVKKIVVEHIGVESDRVSDDAKFIEYLCA